MSPRPFSNLSRPSMPWRMVAASALAALAAGCASVSIEDAVPAGALGGTSTSSAAAPVGTLPPPAAPGVLPASAGSTPAPADPSTAGAFPPAPADSVAPAEPATAVSPPGDASVYSADGVSPAAPRDTGQYPNLNLPPRSATEQFTPADSRLKARELREAMQMQGGTGGAPDKKEAERLEKLGKSHGSDALKAIERR